MVEVDSSEARGVSDMFVMIPAVFMFVVSTNELNVLGMDVSSEREVAILSEL